VNGKLLTNYLKKAVANQTNLDLRKDFYTVNLLKEETCFVSKSFKQDMKNKNKEKKVLSKKRRKRI
jgi:actin-related protein 6